MRRIKYFITGAAGFIGSTLADRLWECHEHRHFKGCPLGNDAEKLRTNADCFTAWLRSLVSAFGFSKIWHYDRPEALALVEQGLGRGLPIYALFVPIKEQTTQQSRLPALPGYTWTISNNSSGNALVLQLSPIEY
jgi:hypothetical protein